MQRVKEITMMDLTDKGNFRILKVGENDVHLIILTAAPDGVFYSVRGDTPGRYFIPMHMISSMEMEAEITN